MQDDVVQHASQTVPRIFGVLQRHFDRLRNGQSEASRTVRVAFQRRAARCRERAGRCDALGAPSVHHQPPVGFLVVADLDHVNLQVYAEVLGRECDRRAPLPRARLGGQAADALLVVVVGLRHGGVGLVRSGRRDALVLEIDFRGRAERLLQPRSPHERRGSPYFVNLLHLFGNVDEPLRGHLLIDQLFGENGAHLLFGYGLLGRGMQRGQRFVGHVGHDVVPLRGHLILGQAEFFRFHSLFYFSVCFVKVQKKKPAVYSLVNNGLVAGIRFQLYTHGAALIVHESQRAPPPSLYVEIANHILFGKYNGSDP